MKRLHLKEMCQHFDGKGKESVNPRRGVYGMCSMGGQSHEKRSTRESFRVRARVAYVPRFSSTAERSAALCCTTVFLTSLGKGGSYLDRKIYSAT